MANENIGGAVSSGVNSKDYSKCIKQIKVELKKMKGNLDFTSAMDGAFKAVGKIYDSAVKFLNKERETLGKIADDEGDFGKAFLIYLGKSFHDIGEAVSGGFKNAVKAAPGLIEAIGNSPKKAKEAYRQFKILKNEAYKIKQSLENGVYNVEDLVDYLVPLLGDATCEFASLLKDINKDPKLVSEKMGALLVDLIILFAPGGAATKVASKTAKASKLASPSKNKVYDTLAKSFKNIQIKDLDKKLRASVAAAKAKATTLKNSVQKKTQNSSKKTNSTGGTSVKSQEQQKGQGEPSCPTCALASSNPVNAIQGCKVLDGSGGDTDFVLQSPLPIAWSRQYASNSAVGAAAETDPIGWFGQGWATSWGMHLNVVKRKDLISLIDAYGRVISFPYIAPHSSFYSHYEDIRLHHDEEGQYRLTSGSSELGDGISMHFDTPENINTAHKHTVYCTGVSDSYGNRTLVEYHDVQLYPDKASLPAYIQDCLGRVLQLHFTKLGNSPYPEKNYRLTQIDELVGLHKDNVLKLPAEQAESLLALPRMADRQALLTSKDIRIDSAHKNLDTVLTAYRTLVRYEYSSQADLTYVYEDNTPVAKMQGITDNSQQTFRCSRRFEWTNHVMVAHHEPNGLSSYYTYDKYDKDGKVIQNRLSTGGVIDLEYFSDHSIVTNNAGTYAETTEIFHFDAEQNWTGTTDAYGNKTTFELDRYNNVVQITDPDGGITRFDYNGGNMTSQRQLLGYDAISKQPQWRESQYFYKDNRLEEVLDPLGNSTQLAYNQAGDVISVTDALGFANHSVYNQQGLVRDAVHANGGKNSMQYDAHARLIRQTDCSGNSTHYQYDELGRITQITDALGQVTKLSYDTATDRTDSPTQIHYPDDSHESMQYDSLGRLVSHTDALQRTTTYEYTDDDLPIKRTDALHGEIRYVYDGLRRLSKLINENNVEWQFSYDKLGRLIEETNFDGKRSTYRYSAGGKLLEQVDHSQRSTDADEQHISTRYEYDALGQLLCYHSVDSTNPKQRTSTHFSYDDAGQLIKASNANSTTSFEYDAVGQLITETLTAYSTDPHSNKQVKRTQTLTHEYDGMGNRTKTTLPDGKVLRNLYYGSGHLISQSIEDQGKITELRHTERNALHQEIKRQQGMLTSDFTYDHMGRLTHQHTVREQVTPQTSQTKHLIQRQYQYDQAGQLTQIKGVTQGKQGIQSYQHRYGYDALSRLTAHELSLDKTSLTQNFAFDPASNRLPVGGNTSEQDNNKEGYQTKRPKQINTKDKTINYEYDQYGRVTKKTIQPNQINNNFISNNSLIKTKQTTELIWNNEHQLTQSITTKHRAGIETVITTDYAYDAFGRRINKYHKTSVKQAHQNISQAKVTKSNTFILWDANRQLQEYTDTHVFTTIYEVESFEPIARLTWLKQDRTASNDEHIDNPNAINIYHYHNDHLGTPQELTNTSGNIVWQCHYEAWGNTVAEYWQEIEVTEEQIQPIRFQGQTIDQETGLHYNRFRYYDPDVGMFVSEDPIGLAGGYNTFQYAPNPIGWIDPWGLNKVISGVDPTKINYSQHYIEDPERIKSMIEDMKNGKFDWKRSPLNVQIIDGQMVSGDNRRLYAANEAGCDCSIVIRDPSDPLPGGGTYGKNLKKKLNSSPLKSGLPRVNVGPTGTSKTPVIYDKNNRTLNGVPIQK